MSETSLTRQDQTNLRVFLTQIFENYSSGKMGIGNSVSCIEHLVNAIDQGDMHEFRRWIEEGRPACQEARPD